MTWQPGRLAGRIALEEPFEGVPSHLFAPVWKWIEEVLENGYSLADAALRLRLALPADPRRGPNAFRQDMGFVYIQCREDVEFMLDLVEVVLDGPAASGQAIELHDLLERGNSKYRVREDLRGLAARVPPEIKAQVEQAINDAPGSPGEHLAEAWNLTYARTPDPVKAFSEGIKAVESAAAPTISPADGKATLGKMIAAIKSKPSKWKFAIEAQGGGVEHVLGLMKLLWDGQTSRHGGNAPTRPETPEEARAAVHAAATLVQLHFRSVHPQVAGARAPAPS